jgi:hypothetical protein
MSDYCVSKDAPDQVTAVTLIENEHDLRALRKGRCPWCLEYLSPSGEETHEWDVCFNCGDRFA